MGFDSSKRSIPLEQRFQEARVIRKSLTSLELELIDCPWAKLARVRQEHLPQEMQVGEYQIGKPIQVFLLHPSSDDPHRYFASVRWAEPSSNPWLSASRPRIGHLASAEAIRFRPDNRGVFVRLRDNDVEAWLGASEVPGNPGDIRAALNLGDQLYVKITAVRQDILEVDVSLAEALRILDAEETKRRQELFNRDPLEICPREEWSLPRKPGLRIGILVPDIFFREHLSLWLEAFGFTTLRLNDPAHLHRVLQARNAPSHLIWAPESWPHEAALATALRREISQKRLPIVWLNGPSSPEIPPFQAASIDLPLHLDRLMETLTSGENAAVKPHQQTRGWLFDDYQSRHVQHLVERFLESLCAQLNLDGALWVVREQPGLFHLRASHNLDRDELEKLESRLGQTMIADSIEKNETLDWEYAKLGPLKPLVPAQADRVCCLPIPFTPLFGTEQVVHRAVALFYQSTKQSGSLERRLGPYREAMEILVHTLQFARHNETLSALAELGRRSASYLHELGQKALPLQAFLDRHTYPGSITDEDWSRLRGQLAELIDMARTDLARIRKQHQDRLQLRERLTRLTRLYGYRFNAANCGFEISLPDLPMLLTFNPLILDQAVSNLLDNALHFAGQRDGAGRVVLAVKLEPQGDPSRPLAIEVTDNGPGVRASMKGRLFEPPHIGKTQGTGMGLFIARSFVQGLGGDLQLVESLRWKSTCFRIRLPVIFGQGVKS